MRSGCSRADSSVRARTMTQHITESALHYCTIYGVLTYDLYFIYHKVSVEEQDLLITYIELTRQRNLLLHNHFNYCTIYGVLTYDLYFIYHKVSVEEQDLLITHTELTRQRNLLRHNHFN